jgi:VWFA-related protein
MVRTVRHLSPLVALVLATASAVAQQQPTFRSGTQVVTIDVSVRRGNVPVTGLTAADFTVTDRGVAQTIDAVTVEALPLNVTLLLDTSGSIEGLVEGLRSQLHEAAGLLSDDDRVRLLMFAGEISQASPFQSPKIPLPLDSLRASGGTSLYDALALALTRTRPPDRGELVVGFSDGIDTTSAVGVKRLKDVAARSEAVLHMFVVRTPALIELCTRPDKEAKPWLCDDTALSEVASATGGRVYSLLPQRHVPKGLERALEDFRSSYMLRYTPKGVELPGWHDVRVAVANGKGYDVRARRGYFGR